MKKFLSMMLIMTSLVCFLSCSNDEEYRAPQEVDLTLDYTFVESGSMTKVTGADVYDDFYNTYIKTEQLTPTSYSLTFRSKETNETVLSIDGTWCDDNSIRLPEGEYIVTGKSQPKERETYYGYEYPSDTAYLIFNENVKIIRDMKDLTLRADYDAFLMLFDSSNVNKICLYNGDSLSSNGEVFWLFMRDKNYRTSSGSSTGYYDLTITRKNNDVINIKVKDIPFEKGKYYYFNDMTNSFDIPKMESGN
ncbi:MAG: hypothetical protein J6Q25_05720 [Bacteroidales bacterium]|nr:hypothetical protein [Bacteroidales bacterium]